MCCCRLHRVDGSGRSFLCPLGLPDHQPVVRAARHTKFLPQFLYAAGSTPVSGLLLPLCSRIRINASLEDSLAARPSGDAVSMREFRSSFRQLTWHAWSFQYLSPLESFARRAVYFALAVAGRGKSKSEDVATNLLDRNHYGSSATIFDAV